MTVTSTAFLPFHRALIEREEMQGVMDVLHSGWLTTGPKVREFESSFARYVGAAHGVAVASCTAALHLALAAIDLQEADEVILPTMTFAATGEVVRYFRARPVLVDCAKDSFHIDPQAVERAITPRTKAIIPVHFAGCPCDMDAILAIAEKHGVRVIEDAAHSLPARYNGRMIGSLGDMTCFSFYATKTLTTGEGGMITTENPQYAARLRILSLHGISKDAWKRYTSEGTWRYDILETGYKYNLSDLQAALGLAQLSKCDRMRDARASIAEFYTRALRGLDAYEVPADSGDSPDSHHAWHLYVIQVNADVLRIDRNSVIEELKDRGIGTSVHFIPLHLHTLYRQLGYSLGEFPNAEERFSASISLPIYPSLTEEDTGRVAEALYDIARGFRR
jgi:perosamine synthetase